GVDPTNWQHNIFILNNPGCGWAGTAMLGGHLSWVNKATNPFIYAHELGHNFGMHHAATPEYEYADYSCPMGGAWKMTNYNAPHINQMSWDQKVPGMTTKITESGIYDISTLGTKEDSLISPSIVMFDIPDTEDTYFLSYRNKIGLDKGAPLADAYLNKLSIHTRQTLGHERSMLKKIIKIGDIYYDIEHNISVEMLSVNATGSSAQVYVNFESTNPCIENEALLEVTSPTQIITSGTEATYNITIENRDNSVCKKRAIPLYSTSNSYMSTDLPSSIELDPGETKTLTFRVNIDREDGMYYIILRADKGAYKFAEIELQRNIICSNENYSVKWHKKNIGIRKVRERTISYSVTNNNEYHTCKIIVNSNPTPRAVFTLNMNSTYFSIQPGETKTFELNVYRNAKRPQYKKRRLPINIGIRQFRSTIWF
ncbi:hypothetical protein OAB57_03655, partial [Bacteriovoracaceae bacterium]|nr:hypothetical protein [Bacteriovoracaceae bacterium]